MRTMAHSFFSTKMKSESFLKLCCLRIKKIGLGKSSEDRGKGGHYRIKISNPFTRIRPIGGKRKNYSNGKDSWIKGTQN